MKSICIETNVISVITKELAVKHCVIPFEIKQGILGIAVNNPLNDIAMNDIKFSAKMDLSFYLAEKKDILSAIYTNYFDVTSELVVQELRKKYERKIPTNGDIVETNELFSAPIVKFVNMVLSKAITKNASDIHIEPYKDFLVIRFRIDGILQEVMKISKNIYSALTARIKILAKLNITEKRQPQDGKIHFDFNGLFYDLRVSTVPSVFGEKIVIRILSTGDKLISLEIFNNDYMENFDIYKILNNSKGMILVTGPTGSGKSTTLSSMLKYMNKKDINITTIEDPVEYTLSGITQINIQENIGLTFAKGLRTILRQDPDVIMVGEIRDEETAEIAVRASITGHIMLTTLHTRNAASCISRLKDMGIPQYLIADALDLVIAQRLVRKICEKCKVKYKISEFEERQIKKLKVNELYRGTGCNECNFTGYSGRTLAYEIIFLDVVLRRIIAEGADTAAIQKHCSNVGMINLETCLVKLLKGGVISMDEYMKNSCNDCGIGSL